MNYIFGTIATCASAIYEYVTTPSQDEMLAQKYLTNDPKHWRTNLINDLVNQFFQSCGPHLDSDYDGGYIRFAYEIKFHMTESWSEVEKLLNEDGSVENVIVRAWCKKWKDRIANMRSLHNSIEQYQSKLQQKPQDENLVETLKKNIREAQETIAQILEEARKELDTEQEDEKLKNCPVSKNAIDFIKKHWSALTVFSHLPVSMDEKKLVAEFITPMKGQNLDSKISEDSIKGIYLFQDGELETMHIDPKKYGGRINTKNMFRPKEVIELEANRLLSKSPHPNKRMDRFEDDPEYVTTSSAIIMEGIIEAVKKIVNGRLKDCQGYRFFLETNSNDNSPVHISILPDIKGFLWSHESRN